MKTTRRARIVAAVLSVCTTYALVTVIATYAYPIGQTQPQLVLAATPR